MRKFIYLFFNNCW